MSDQPLSPAAQAVLDAAFNVDQPESFDDCVIEDYCPVIAAALRAVAEQCYFIDDDGCEMISVLQLLAIATELENHS